MEMSVKSVVKSYVRHHYVISFLLKIQMFDPYEKQWVAELISSNPRINRDDRYPQERTLRFLTLRGLGTVKVSENLSPNSINATPRIDLVENLNGYLKLWQERTNRVIIKASSLNLAKTNAAQIFLGKIGVIISRLERKDIIRNGEIDNFTEREAAKIRRYLELLEGLEIVKRNENGYSYGNMYASLCYEAQKHQVDLNTAILSYIIKNRYPALKETFGITHLESIVHIDSLYYRPALEADDLIYWKYESFEEHCNMLYGYNSKLTFKLPYILNELVKTQALKCEDKLYFGNQDLWKEMKENINTTEFTLPRA
jgi:hypothetical protein